MHCQVGPPVGGLKSIMMKELRDGEKNTCLGTVRSEENTSNI